MSVDAIRFILGRHTKYMGDGDIKVRVCGSQSLFACGQTVHVHTLTHLGLSHTSVTYWEIYISHSPPYPWGKDWLGEQAGCELSMLLVLKVGLGTGQ